ncbi:MAG: hypothetical protein WC679_12400 [Bacteroidales bacterium]|jgi:hypothetical protein
METIKKDKKGMAGIIYFFVFLFAVLILGFIAAIVLGIISYGSDQITPVMEGIGVVGDTNISEAAVYTFGVSHTMVNLMPYLLVFAFALALIFSVVVVVGYGQSSNPMFIGLYIALILLLIVVSIVISNAYEEIYNGTDEIAINLQEQTAMSYMILYSPTIFVIIAFITGIFLFAGKGESGGGV